MGKEKLYKIRSYGIIDENDIDKDTGVIKLKLYSEKNLQTIKMNYLLIKPFYHHKNTLQNVYKRY
jgi:hypothetical protein